MKINKNLIKYFKTNSGISFVKYFYGIYINKKDVKDFNDYSNTILYREGSLSPSKISKLINVSKRKIEHWVYEGNKPFIIRLLEHHLKLSVPSNNCKWLSINSTRGGLFSGPWIEVPDRVQKYPDIQKVMKQLRKISNNYDYFSNKISQRAKFAFLLGMLIGDSSKTGIKRRQRITRRLHLRLTKRYKTNKVLGNFTSLCVNSLGLRMKRCKDCPAGKRNVYPFYTWISQSSLFFQWLFRSCIGLKNNELTTYHPIRAEWILNSPKEFKIYFIQGLAESDGYVDFSSHQVGIITHPNTKLIKNILNSLNINPSQKLITRTNLWTLVINYVDAYRMPVFNPQINSYRYQYMEKLYKAKRISGHWPDWLSEKIEQNIRKGIKGTALVKKIINEEGVAIRTKNIQRRVRRLKE